MDEDLVLPVPEIGILDIETINLDGLLLNEKGRAIIVDADEIKFPSASESSE